MFNLQSQQWYQFKIFTKLKYVAADGAGCFVACIDPLELKKKKEIHYYVTLPANSSSVTPVCSRTGAGDWMQIECICEKRGLLEKRGDISWESGYTLYSPSMRSEISSYIWNNFAEGFQDLSCVQQRSKCSTPQHLQTVCPNYSSSVPGRPRWSHSAVWTQLLDYQ